jgi:type I restriction enzyme S subunit
MKTDFRGLIDYIDISSIDNQSKTIATFQIIDAENAPSRAKQIIHKNDILVSTVRPNLNAVAVVDLETPNCQIASTGYCVLRCTEKANYRYVFYFCTSPIFVGGMTSQASGASYPAVSNSIVKSALINLLFTAGAIHPPRRLR